MKDREIIKTIDCDCKEWKENMPLINSAFIFEAVHGGKGYQGDKFNYCPWCAKSLHKITIERVNVKKKP